jgi:hypothetical protein
MTDKGERELVSWERKKEEEFQNYRINHACSICNANSNVKKHCNNFVVKKGDRSNCGNKKCSHGKEQHSIVIKVMLGCSVCDSCDAFEPNPFVPTLCENCKHINTSHSREVEDSILSGEIQQGNTRVEKTKGHIVVVKKSKKELDADVRKNLWKKRWNYFLNRFVYRLPLDVREFVNAMELRCTDSSVELTSVKMSKLAMQKISGALADNTSLKTLVLHGHELLPEFQFFQWGAMLLAEALGENNTLTELRIPWHDIGLEGVLALASSLKDNAKLALLDISYNKILIPYDVVHPRLLGVQILSSVLINDNYTLTDLNIGGNYIGDDGFESIAGIIRNRGCELKRLNIHSSNLTDASAYELASALDGNTSMTHIQMWDNDKITVDGISAIFEVLRDAMILNMEVFQINHWPIPVQMLAGTDAVASELMAKVIDVSGGQLCARDAVALGLLLYRNHVCNKLVLRDTNLSDDGKTQAGFFKIADAMKTCHLVTLDLSNTGLTEDGSRAIGRNLENNVYLQDITIDNIRLPVRDLLGKDIVRQRGRVDTKAELDFSAIKLTKPCIPFMAELLKHNTTIKKLNR